MVSDAGPSVEVVQFFDQYDLVSPLLGRSPAELRARDGGRPQPVRRWLALRDGAAVGAATALRRPDERTFLRFVGDDLSVYRPLTEAAVVALGTPLYATADEDRYSLVGALTNSGFAIEFVSERFRARFDAVLASLARAWVPSGFSIRSAHEVEEDRLFALDNTVRQDVPGTDGWRGDRQWFRDELVEAPPFDPEAYLVAIDDRTGDYVGLVRVWRNSDGPRFGLVGVVRKCRSTPIAAALIKRALQAASAWGYDTFTTETGLTNQVIYPRLKRVGAKSDGRFLQLVRR